MNWLVSVLMRIRRSVHCALKSWACNDCHLCCRYHGLLLYCQLSVGESSRAMVHEADQNAVSEAVALKLRRTGSRGEYLYPQIYAGACYILASCLLFELHRRRRVLSRNKVVRTDTPSAGSIIQAPTAPRSPAKMPLHLHQRYRSGAGDVCTPVVPPTACYVVNRGVSGVDRNNITV